MSGWREEMEEVTALDDGGATSTEEVILGRRRFKLLMSFDFDSKWFGGRSLYRRWRGEELFCK